MRSLVCVLIALLCALLVSAQLEKRASMGGSAFGAMDRIPLEFLQKFYRIGQKRTFEGYAPYERSYYSIF